MGEAMTELDFKRLLDRVNNLTQQHRLYVKKHKKEHQNIENPSDTYIEEKINDEFRKRYNDIYEQIHRIDERLNKLENNKEALCL